MIVVKKENETINEAIKRTLEEKEKQMEKHREPKKWDEKFLLIDGFVRIIYGDQFVSKTIFPEDFNFNHISFKQLLDKLNIKYNAGVIYVWIEGATLGEIWMFGNDPSSREWFFHGETNGYC